MFLHFHKNSCEAKITNTEMSQSSYKIKHACDISNPIENSDFQKIVLSLFCYFTGHDMSPLLQDQDTH
jgi:hypothetical protein